MSKFNFIYAEDLSHREKTVYIYLRDRADASGVCWPGIKTIAGELGLSPRTVQRALADLEHRQLIEKRQRHRANGSLTSNLYRLTAAKKSQGSSMRRSASVGRRITRLWAASSNSSHSPAGLPSRSFGKTRPQLRARSASASRRSVA